MESKAGVKPSGAFHLAVPKNETMLEILAMDKGYYSLFGHFVSDK